MEFLIISKKHGLIPLAYRLRLEGHDVQTVVWKHRFEKAWEGKITKALRGSKKEITREMIDLCVQKCESGDVVFLTDVESLNEPFAKAKRRYGVLAWPDRPVEAVRVGGWFDGERLLAHHLLIGDVGVWPHGLGALELGGMTLVVPRDGLDLGFLEDLWRPFLDRLKAQDFRGLVNAGLRQSETGGIELHGAEAGWPWLQTHAFLSELEGFGEVLAGEREPVLPKKFVTVAPVSVPPWPAQDARGALERPVNGLTPKQMGNVFWHDVVIDDRAKTLNTAGLDGLVGVVRGAADSPLLARSRMLDIAVKMGIVEKQFRPDVAESVPLLLASLERQFGLVV